MTWRDKLELGLKGDAAFRKDNLPPDEVHGPEEVSRPGRSPVVTEVRDRRRPPQENPAPHQPRYDNAAAEAGGDAQGNEGRGQSGPDKPADDGDPHSVPRQQLLAENTPSVLRQLRPMDISSDRMLRFLRTRQP
jgi:hypothetical protein